MNASRGKAFEKTVVINGKMTAADVYTSAALFEALSGTLLESYALEALLTREGTQPSGPPSKQPGRLRARNQARETGSSG